MAGRLTSERLAGALVVAALHAGALYGLWSHRLLPTPADATTLFVDFIAPPPPKEEQPRRLAPPMPRVAERPSPQQLVAEAPVSAATDAVAPPPKPAPAAEPAAAPAGPLVLSSELAVACPERTAPLYPMLSRRQGETGTVVLRVELDEQGLVTSARIDNGSGFERLDNAALAAVKTWRCQPPRRNGQAVRAVARQPFKFSLQGS